MDIKTKNKPLAVYEYDLEMLRLYFHISEFLNSYQPTDLNFDKKSYLRNIYELIEIASKRCNKAFNLSLRNREPIIIPSTDYSYHRLLALSLAFYDVPKIISFLNYQKENFDGSPFATKNNFVGLVEFNCYRIIGQYSLSKTEQRMEKIMQWVEKEREKSNIESNKKVNGPGCIEIDSFYYWQHGLDKLNKIQGLLLNPNNPFIVQNDFFIKSFVNRNVDINHKTLWINTIKSSFAFLYFANDKHLIINKEPLWAIAEKLFQFPTNPSSKSLSESFYDFKTRIENNNYLEKKFRDLLQIFISLEIKL